jgi:hypothetical protein
LTKLVAAALGHELDQTEVDGFNESTLLGKQLCVLIDAKAGTDGTVWNNIISYSKATKQLPKFDDSEMKDRQAVKKSQPAVADDKVVTYADPDSFEKEMDANVAKKAKA